MDKTFIDSLKYPICYPCRVCLGCNMLEDMEFEGDKYCKCAVIVKG